MPMPLPRRNGEAVVLTPFEHLISDGCTSHALKNIIDRVTGVTMQARLFPLSQQLDLAAYGPESWPPVSGIHITKQHSVVGIPFGDRERLKNSVGFFPRILNGGS